MPWRKSFATSLSCQQGFSLLELVMVMMLIAILAGMGSQFIVSSTSMYHDTVERGKLVAKGRLALERLSRHLRIALPNSLRVSTDGSCIEYLPVVGASSYDGQVADFNNGMPASGSISTAAFNLDLGSATYVAIAAQSPAEIYLASPDSLAVINSVASTNATQIDFAAHIFAHNSARQRVFVVDNPHRICLRNGELRLHSNYGLPGDGSGNAPSTAPNSGSLLVDGIDSGGPVTFALSGSTEDRNMLVHIQLPLSQGSEHMLMTHKVMVRNVP